MNSKFFFLLLSVCFTSFVPVYIPSGTDDYEKYKIKADGIFNANQQKSDFSFQTIYNSPDMEQARVAVMTGDIFGNKEKNALEHEFVGI